MSLIGSADKPLGVEWKDDFIDYNEMHNQVLPIWTISRHKKRVDLHEIHKTEYSNREHGQVLNWDGSEFSRSHIYSAMWLARKKIYK